MGLYWSKVTPAPTCFFQTQAIRVPGFRPVVFPFCWFDKNFKSPGDFEKHLIHPPGGAFCEMLEGPNFQLELTKKGRVRVSSVDFLGQITVARDQKHKLRTPKRWVFLEGEVPVFHKNLDWWNIIIWPQWMIEMIWGRCEAVKRKENTQVKLPLQNLWWSQDNLPWIVRVPNICSDA